VERDGSEKGEWGRTLGSKEGGVGDRKGGTMEECVWVGTEKGLRVVERCVRGSSLVFPNVF
jgi:hypothetical protein